MRGPTHQGVIVAAGTITSSGGAPMSGEKVRLFSWPPDAVLKAMKPGQSVPSKLLTSGITDSAGRYTLQVPQAAVNAVAAGTGYVNLEIVSADGFSFFTYQASASPESGEPTGPVTVNLGGRGQSKNPDCGKDPEGRHYLLSNFVFQRPRHFAWAVVGQGYILRSRGTRGDTVGFRYTKGSSHSQDSSLGVGISGQGFDAGYTTAGSHTSTATNSEGYGAEPRSTWFRTTFNTGQYRALCLVCHDGSSCAPFPHRVNQKHCPKTAPVSHIPVHKCFWMIHSRGWSGGTSLQHPGKAPHTPRSDCREHAHNGFYHGDHGSAVKWSKGFTLGADLGIKGVKAGLSSTPPRTPGTTSTPR